MYTALHLSATEYHNFSMPGFKTEDLAWDYIAGFRCSLCQADEEEIFACDAEWMVITDEEYFS